MKRTGRWSKSPTGKFGNITGLKFGLLRVLDFAYVNNRRRYWNCKCDCGGEVLVTTGHLRDGRVQSCGCVYRRNLVRFGQSMKGKIGDRHPSWRGGVALRNATIRTMKAAARKRGYTWMLTDEDLSQLLHAPCFYCGGNVQNVRRDPSYAGVSNKEFAYMGIDRVNNMLGYSRENCVSSCAVCNRAKGGTIP